MDKISRELLTDWESLVAEGETSEVLTKLRAVREKTAYKNEILTLSSRWDALSRDQMSATLSSDEESRRENQLNKDLLRLIAAMQRESEGERVEKNLLGAQAAKREVTFPITVLIAAMLLTGLAIGLVSYFAWHKPETTCPNLVDLNGTWEVFTNGGQADLSLGYMKIKQDACEKDFHLSGALNAGTGPAKEIDFTAGIAAIHEGKIVFNYENFDGEKGTCTGIEPGLNGNEFTVVCIDLIGFDRNDEPRSSFRFRKK